MNNKTSEPKKCYNTFSCIASVLIIIFITGAILLDLLVTKPQIYNSIENVRMEVEMINKKIDQHYSNKLNNTYRNLVDSLENEIIYNQENK